MSRIKRATVEEPVFVELKQLAERLLIFSRKDFREVRRKIAHSRKALARWPDRNQREAKVDQIMAMACAFADHIESDVM